MKLLPTNALRCVCLLEVLLIAGAHAQSVDEYRVKAAFLYNFCQILFVNASERKRAAKILPELKATGVLTVGETEGFAAEGGVINFKTDDGQVRLEVNVAAAERARLRISSKLLNLAQIVRR